MKRSDSKHPQEVVDLSFDFANYLGAASIQAGTPLVTASVIEGADPDVATTLQGAPTIVGTIVFQRMRNGLKKVDYGYLCKITASDGRVLVLELHVPVRGVL